MPGTSGGDFTVAVAAVVAAIPPGSVATYGEVAVEAGYPVGASRAVGNVCQRVDDLPWWRVVTASGRLVPGAEGRHARHLAAEGVEVVDDHVVMARRPRSARQRGPRSPVTATPGRPTDRTGDRRG